jgi:tetratricopeptide (TPR) repeat protein
LLGVVFLLARGGAVWYVVPCCPQRERIKTHSLTKVNTFFRMKNESTKTASTRRVSQNELDVLAARIREAHAGEAAKDFALRVGIVPQALSRYEAALQNDPNNLTALHNKAAVLYDMNKVSEAKSTYFKILDINSNFAMAYYGLGVISEKEKNYKDAINYYNKFVASTDNQSLKTTIQRRISLLKSRV